MIFTAILKAKYAKAKYIAACITLLAAFSGHARELNISLQNITGHMSFRPILVAASPAENHLFQVDKPASTALQTMAECGDIAPLVKVAEDRGDAMIVDPAKALRLLLPGEVTEGKLSLSEDQSHLSIVSMMLPSNDAFVGLDALSIPKEPGYYVFMLSAYDAGTEVNNEIESGVSPLDCKINQPGYPVDPLGLSGTGGSGIETADSSPNVHLHRGHEGDLDPIGGLSNLDRIKHRWNNPVARLVIEVK